MNRETFKIILSAFLVVLLITFGIYVFIFRNEISQQIQQFTRNPDPAGIERMILDPAKKTGTLEEFEKKEKNGESALKQPENEARTNELDEIPGAVIPPGKEVFPGDAPVRDFRKPVVPPAAQEPVKKRIVKEEETVAPAKRTVKTPVKQKKVVKRSATKKKKYTQKRKKRVSRLTRLERRVRNLENRLKIGKSGNKKLEDRIYLLEKRVSNLEKNDRK